jgi:hypothetical protein
MKRYRLTSAEPFQAFSIGFLFPLWEDAGEFTQPSA